MSDDYTLLGDVAASLVERRDDIAIDLLSDWSELQCQADQIADRLVRMGCRDPRLALRTVDPLRVRLEPLDHGFDVVLDDEHVGHVEPAGDCAWSAVLLGSPTNFHGPASRKGVHAAVCAALVGLQA